MSYYYSSGQDYYPSGDEIVRKVYRNIERRGHKHHHHSHSGHHSGHHHHHHHHHAHQTIVNDGTMVINGDSLRQVDSVIYNRPGSTVYMTDAHYYTSPSSSSRAGTSYYYGAAPRYASGLHACRGCSSWHRDLAGGYCRGCIEYKVRPGRTIEVVKESRRVGAPERRLIQYR